jgi:DNA-binding MarR family transcriptional regulator
VLFILTKNNHVNQKQLAELTFFEKSSLNRNLKWLIDAELVAKKEAPPIQITTKGKALRDQYTYE